MKTLNYTFLNLISACLLSFTGFSQQGIQANLGLVNRPTPKIGFNTNGHMPVNFPTGNLGANWAQQAFMDSTACLNPAILRFPGGTNANHWDWQTGWYMPGYQPPFPALTIRPEEFQPGLNAVNQAEGLYVMNLETSTINHEMDGLRHMNSLGLNPTMIELGNEHNLSNANLPLQFMTSAGYAQMAKAFYDSIKLINPLSKICVVGSNTGQRPDWHTQILAQNPAIDAFAWHAYTNANNVDLVFNVNRAFSEAFADVNHNGSLAYRYAAGGFDVLPPDKEVWVTEYNLWEMQQTSAAVIGTTWTHSLYLMGLHNFFLAQNNVTMFLNHSLASIDACHEAISRVDHHISANGVAMKLILDVAKGSQTVQDITFAGNPSITYASTTFPKLTAWKFTHTDSEKGLICNFSLDTFKISLNQAFSNPMDFTSFSADTNFVVSGISSLNQFSGTSNDSITILPYSITQITSNFVNGITQAQTQNDFVIYPNPVEKTMHFSAAISNFKVYSIQGKLILDQEEKVSSLNTTSWENGIYLLVKNNQAQRFIVNH